MSEHSIQLLMLVTQALGVVVLVVYAFEARRLRIVSRQQVESSQKLMEAAMDQVEGLSKPCLTIASRLRDGADIILTLHGAVGNLVAEASGGLFVLQNIGNGIALNVSYRFVPIDDPANPDFRRRVRYVANLLPEQKIPMVESLNTYRGQFQLVIQYQSIGGRKYQSTVTLNNHVLTGFKLGPLQEEAT